MKNFPYHFGLEEPMNNIGAWLWDTRLGNGVLGFIYSGLVIFIVISIYMFISKSSYIMFIPVGFALAIIGGGIVYAIRGEDNDS